MVEKTDTRLLLKKKDDAITFKIRVQPRSSQNTVARLLRDALKIKLNTSPVDGAANAMSRKYIYRTFLKYLNRPLIL